MEEQASYAMDGLMIGLTAIFILLNGFFVAAEFALVKLRKSRLDTMVAEKKAFATTALWLYKRQNLALSACQLGITMASLALGWIGEPAIAHLITPLITKLGINSEAVIHGIAFTIAFSIITSLHIVIGEQVPKIYAIRRPGIVFLASAGLLKAFYIILFPFMYGLNAISMIILKWMGIEGSGEHDFPLSEEEIKATLAISYAKGELTHTEHNLMDAVFRFDEKKVHEIMIPRSEVEILDSRNSVKQNLELARKSKHSRFPYCQDSLDNLIGLIHVKDLFANSEDETLDLSSLAKPAMYVPEKILIGELLQEFRSTRKHLAFVQDEHGTILGVVTFEDVLEVLVGNVEDEFDNEIIDITKQKDGKYLVGGDVLLEEISTRLGVEFESPGAETLSGMIVERFGHKLMVGKVLDLGDGNLAEIVEINGIRATKVLLKLAVAPK